MVDSCPQRMAAMSRFLPVTTGCFWPRLCKNVLEHVWQSRLEQKSRSYANFWSADYTSTSRFYVATQTSKRHMRFYTLWAVSTHCSFPKNDNQSAANRKHRSFAKRLYLPSSSSRTDFHENLGGLRPLSVKPIRQCVAVQNGVANDNLGNHETEARRR